MTSSFVNLDLDPCVRISKPSSRGGSSRLGQFLNGRKLWDIKPNGKTNNFLKPELNYIQPRFDLITMKPIRMKPNPKPNSSHRY